MKIVLFGRKLEGTPEQFRQIIAEIDTAPELEGLPERKREIMKYEIERALSKATPPAAAGEKRGQP